MFSRPSSSLSFSRISSLYLVLKFAISSYPLRANRLASRLEYALLFAIFDSKANTISLVGFRIQDRNVRSLNSRFFLYDTARSTQHRVRLLMFLDHVDARNNQFAVSTYGLHFTALTFVLPAMTITSSSRRIFFISCSLYSTSGASEIIFMNCSPRNSRVTGPKIRVPIGCMLLFRRTAALPSNLIREPSGRRTPFLVRTTTAFITWPFLTLPRGIASLTDTLMMSPICA